MNKETVLNRIKKIIEDSNLTNSEFAEKIGVPKSSISHLLSERNNPSLDVIIKISETFEHISTDYLIFGYENDTETPSEPLNKLFDDLDEFKLGKNIDLNSNINNWINFSEDFKATNYKKDLAKFKDYLCSRFDDKKIILSNKKLFNEVFEG